MTEQAITELCAEGSYTAEPCQTQCVACPEGTTTTAPGSTFSEDCFGRAVLVHVCMHACMHECVSEGYMHTCVCVCVWRKHKPSLERKCMIVNEYMLVCSFIGV